ncbi:MAG: hypothetical protein JSV83_18145 [Desulfobacterales bacterium]|nr:MAG: hypothetical protein JSV83_18145 [Desulfobacterales bacterium]
MRQAIKAALLSGLVYPGSGQLILGHIFSGVSFIGLITVGFGILIYRIARRVCLIIDQVLPMLAKDAVDFKKIIASMDQAAYSSWDVELISIILVVSCWIAATLHAYFVGKRLDQQED